MWSRFKKIRLSKRFKKKIPVLYSRAQDLSDLGTLTLTRNTIDDDEIEKGSITPAQSVQENEVKAAGSDIMNFFLGSRSISVDMTESWLNGELFDDQPQVNELDPEIILRCRDIIRGSFRKNDSELKSNKFEDVCGRLSPNAVDFEKGFKENDKMVEEVNLRNSGKSNQLSNIENETAFKGIIGSWDDSFEESNEHLPRSSSTTSEDLMEWCHTVTSSYPGIKVTNMTTSWRNGLAFCAIIHYFRPDLIDISSLSPADIETNCKLAFGAASKLGIPRIIEPQEMLNRTVPEKSAVTAYLHKLRAHFTEQKIDLAEIGSTARESGYNGMEEDEEEIQYEGVRKDKLEDDESGQLSLELSDEDTSLANLGALVNNAFHEYDDRNDSLNEKMYSEREIYNQNRTYKSEQANNAFNGFENSKEENINEVSEQLKKISSKLEKIQRSNPTSPKKSKFSFSRLKSNKWRFKSNSGSFNLDRGGTCSLPSTPVHAPKLMTRKQLMNPFDSDSDEEDIRQNVVTMKNKGGSKEEEERYIRKWFNLVNKRNSLLRREMQLNIQQKDQELQRRFKILNKELISMPSIEEWEKTEAQKKREKILLDELLAIVNERNELVHHLDTQEKGIEDDEEIMAKTKTGPINEPEKQCILM